MIKNEIRTGGDSRSITGHELAKRGRYVAVNTGKWEAQFVCKLATSIAACAIDGSVFDRRNGA